MVNIFLFVCVGFHRILEKIMDAKIKDFKWKLEKKWVVYIVAGINKLGNLVDKDLGD